MKVPRTAAAIALAALIAAGCAERPLAVAPPAEPQARWETARHWRGFADSMAAALTEAASAGRFGAAGLPLWIAPVAPGSAFGESFRAHLADGLVRRGVPVAAAPDGSVVVNASVRPLPRADGRGRSLPGDWTVAGGIYSGAWLIPDGGFGLPEAAAVIGLGALIDAFLLDQPRAEIAIAVTVLRGGTVAFSATEAVYVPRDSLGEYASAVAPALPVEGVAGGPVRPRAMPVVGEAGR